MFTHNNSRNRHVRFLLFGYWKKWLQSMGGASDPFSPSNAPFGGASDPFSPSNVPLRRVNDPNRATSDPTLKSNVPFRQPNVRIRTSLVNLSSLELLKSLEESTESEQLRLFGRVTRFRPRMSCLDG